MKVSRAGPLSRNRESRRRWRAFALVGLLVVVLAVSGAATRGVLPGVLWEAAQADAWETPSGVLEELGDIGAYEGGMAAPEAFEEEVLPLAGLSEVRVDPRSSVVGFTTVGSAERAFEHAEDELEVRGWTSVDSGSTTCGSFVKGEGKYRWAFVSCVQVGSTTSVVVQSVSEDEGKR